MIRFALSAAPGAEPVTLADVKAHAKIEVALTSEDALVTAYATAARELVERAIGRALITQTWTAKLDRWPRSEDDDDSLWPFFTSPTPRRVRLAMGPLAITSVVVDGVTIDSGDYQLNGDELYIDGSVVDSTATLGNGIVITFTAGYGAAAASVPQQLRLAVLMMAAHLYDARAATSPQGIYHQVIPFGIESLINPYKKLEL